MSKEKNLMKNTVIFMIGNFSTKIITFLLLPFYTYYLSTADYGFVDLVSTSVSFFIPIITFQLMDGCYRYLIEIKDDDVIKKSKVVTNSISIVLRNLIIANIIYITLIMFVDLEYKVLIFFQFNLAIVSSFLQHSIRGLRKNQEYAVAGILSTFFMLVSNIILIVFVGLRGDGLITSTIVSYVVMILYILYSTKFHKYINFKYRNKEMSKKLTRYSIPLIPNYLNWWVMNVSDRLVINVVLGVSSNGIYAIANKFPQIVQLICKMFNMAWQESAITEYEGEGRDKFYSNIFNNYATILLTSMIGMLSVTRILFYFGIDQSFSEAYYYVPFLLYGVVFSTFSSFYGTGYQSSQNTKGAFASSVLGSVLNIILNIIFVPFIGIYAASISTMISFAAMWIYRLIDTRKYFNIKIKWTKFISLLVLTVIYMGIYYVNENIIVQLITITIAIIIFLGFNKEVIMTVLNKKLKRRR